MAVTKNKQNNTHTNAQKRMRSILPREIMELRQGITEKSLICLNNKWGFYSD